MPGRRSRFRGRVLVPALLLLGAIAIAVFVLSRGGGGQAPPRPLESILQDDQLLLYSPTPVVARTLDTLKRLGVDRIRLTILWAAIAPDPLTQVRPRRFAAANPAAYPPNAWLPYDRIVLLARARGIGVDFNVTAPGPLWAMASSAPNAKAANHYRPSASAFGAFVTAVGRRYSGSYRVGSETLPRVSYWTIWNEPNQPGWLWPQWRVVAGTHAMDSPRLYRLYVDAGFAALKRTGHAPPSDTVLIGELAPEGSHGSAERDPIPPMPFLRALYCLDGAYHPLKSRAAAVLHCPSGGSPAAFVAAHPGLFDATGLAHHPYSFFLAPSVHMADPDFAPLADLGRLEAGLDRAFSAYGVNRRLPIYLTEYGYETNPPDPFRGVSPRLQSAYLNQAQYIAAQDPRVRSMAQFLLVDSAPNPAFPRGSQGYWATFQTGLVSLGGASKLSFNAYRLPIYLPNRTLQHGQSALVWGMLRLAPNGIAQRAQVQWRPGRGAYRALRTVSTRDTDGLFSTHVSIPASGAVRISWQAPHGGAIHSRSVGVVVH